MIPHGPAAVGDILFLIGNDRFLDRFQMVHQFKYINREFHGKFPKF